MNLLSLKLSLRELKIIRILCWPYKTWKAEADHRRFLNCGDGERLKRFKNIHDGERCFIIGNGPSLKAADLEFLHSENIPSFASNRIYKIFPETNWRPTYWMCIDENILNDDAGKIHALSGMTCFLSAFAKKLGVVKSDDLYFIFNHQPFRIKKYGTAVKVAFSENIDIAVEAGETVTYNAIQMAAYMGFKKIYLLGVDHNYSQVLDEKGHVVKNPMVKDYFGNIKTENYNIQNSSVATRAYEVAREYCDAHGIHIYNATRGGKLDVFERISLEKVVEQ